LLVTLVLVKRRSVTSALEVYSIHGSPDGLAWSTERRLGEPASRSWLVPVAKDQKPAKLSLASVHPSGHEARIIERPDGMQ
jgi:hypothetical protein